MFLKRTGVYVMNFLKMYSFPILIVVCSCLTFVIRIKNERIVSGTGYQMGAGDFYLNFFGGSEVFEASPRSLLKIPYFLFVYVAYFLLLQSIQREREYSEAGRQRIVRRRKRTQIWTRQVFRLWKSGAICLLCTVLVCAVAGVFVFRGGWQIHSLLQEKMAGLEVGILRQGGGWQLLVPPLALMTLAILQETCALLLSPRLSYLLFVFYFFSGLYWCEEGFLGNGMMFLRNVQLAGRGIDFRLEIWVLLGIQAACMGIGYFLIQRKDIW